MAFGGKLLRRLAENYCDDWRKIVATIGEILLWRLAEKGRSDFLFNFSLDNYFVEISKLLETKLFPVIFL